MEVQQKTPEKPVRFASTPKEKQQVLINKEVANILKYVYQSPKAYYEVNAAIYSEYYDDETVLLKDLLFPEISPLYKTEKFKSYKAQPGLFKQRFLKKLNEGDYPALKEAMGLNKSPDNDISRVTSRIEAVSAVAPSDTALEVFSNSSGVSIYFPYSENYGSNFTPNYFDNINTDPFGNMATIVAADREADSAPGDEPYRKKRTNPETMDIEWYIEYRAVTVDDAYAEGKVTHIVGGGADVMCHNGCTPPAIPTGSPSERIFIGWIRMKGNLEEWDRFISLSKANGGGSEIAIGRGSGYLKFDDEQITNWAGDVIRPDKKFKRKDITNGRWRKLYSTWGPDWKTDDLEQILAVWEDDNKGEQTFTGSLTTTIKRRADSQTYQAGLSYSIKVVSQDVPLKQIKIDRYSYFRAAKFDQGSGFLMSDDKGSRYDTDFLPAGNYWPIYGGNEEFGWTWPYHMY